MSTQIQSLDYEDSTAAGRKIVQLMQALEEVRINTKNESLNHNIVELMLIVNICILKHTFNTCVVEVEEKFCLC
jgi:hypothetical protein